MADPSYLDLEPPAGLTRRPMPFMPQPPAAPQPSPYTQQYADYLATTNLPSLPEPTDEGLRAATSQTPEYAKALASGAYDFASAFPAVYGLGANVVSPGSGDAALRTAVGLRRRGEEIGPQIRDFSQVHGVGDAAQWALNTALSSAPDLALALATGGVGGAVVKGAAKRAALDAAEGLAAKQLKRAGAAFATDEAASAAVAKKAAEIAPRVLQKLTPAAEQAAKVGTGVGTAVGMYPGALASGLEGDQTGQGGVIGADRGDTLKYLVGNTLTAALGAALPAHVLTGRALPEAEQLARGYFSKLGSAALKEGAIGAGAGLGQAVAAAATHKWVDDNVDLLSPEALHGYLSSTAGGGVLGAGLGGGIQAVRGAPGSLGSRVREGVAKVAELREAARKVAQANVAKFTDQFKKPEPGASPDVASPPTSEGAPGAGPKPAAESFVDHLKAVKDSDPTYEDAGAAPDELPDVSGIETHATTDEIPAALRPSDPREQLVATPRSAPEYGELRAKYRDDLLKGATFEENRSSAAGRALFAEKSASPTTVEATGAKTLPVPEAVARHGQEAIDRFNADPNNQRRTLIQLDNLLQRHRAQKNPLTGDDMTTRDAYIGALGDLHLAGIDIKPESIKAGHLGTTRDGEDLGYLNPRDAAYIRNEVSKQYATQSSIDAARAKSLTPEMQARAAQSRADAEQARAAVKPVDTSDDAINSKIDVSEPVRDEPSFDSQVAAGDQNSAHVLMTREAPPQERVPGGSISSQSGVHSVAFDKATGEPRVHEQRADNAAPAPTSFDQVAETPGKAVKGDGEVARSGGALAWYNKITGANARTLKPYKATELLDKLSTKKTLTPEEEKYVGALRDASQDLKEDHPIRQALDAYDEAKPGKPSPPVPEPKVLKDTDFTGTIDKPGEHDTAAETKAVNAVLSRMGLAGEHVTVEHWHDSQGGDKALYVPGANRILVSPNVHGAERVESIAHELGHHVVRAELARAMNVKQADIAGASAHDIFGTPDAHGELSQGLLAQHMPELHDAIAKDYKAWHDKAWQDGKSAADVIASKKPFFRAQSVLRNPELLKQTLADMRGEHVDYVTSLDEYVADQISRSLTHDAQTPVAKFFKAIADKLKLAYDSLFKGAGGKDYAAAPNIEKWVHSLYDRTTLDVSQALGHSVPPEMAKTAVHAAAHVAIDPQSPDGHAKLVDFVRNTLTNDSRAILDRQLRKFTKELTQNIYKDSPEARKNMLSAKDGLEHRIAYAIEAFESGKLKINGRELTIFNNMRENLFNIVGVAGEGTYARRILQDVANGRVAREAKAYNARSLEAAERGAKQQTLDSVRNAWNQAMRPVRNVFNSASEQMERSGVPALRALASQLYVHTGEASDKPGLVTDQTHRLARAIRQFETIFKPLTPEQQTATITAMQERSTPSDPTVAAAVEATKRYMRNAHDYATQSGIQMGKIGDFGLPVVMNVSSDAAAAKLGELLSQPHFAKSIADAGTTVEDLVKHAQARSTGTTPPPADNPTEPQFISKYARAMQFVYDHGTPDDLKQFAALQSKNVGDFTTRYIMPLVREAESVKRFGVGDVKLNALLAEAKTQGASDAQIAQARASVDGARGRVGVDGSPVLTKLLGKELADKIANPKSKRAISAIQTYQNFRLLPLSLVSSLVDPMGIAIRTGGDFKTAWTGFKAGMHSIGSKMKREELRTMLEALGSADEYLVSDTLHSGFGDVDSDATRKYNDALFKYNGLSGWTRATRYMALVAGHKFLTKHAALDGVQSQRYLTELGLTKADIHDDGKGNVRILSDAERESAAPEELARDDRVRNAMLQFVDQAILRPNSQQVPNWMHDPYMGLVSQYKSFGYALWDQISGRIGHELEHGNGHVVLPALSYLPIVIMAEMLRSFVQYGPSGNPNRKDWGPAQYASYGLERSGLAGPKLLNIGSIKQDRQYGNLPGSSFLGPTYQQAGNVADSIAGRRSGVHTLEQALPGENAYIHHI